MATNKTNLLDKKSYEHQECVALPITRVLVGLRTIGYDIHKFNCYDDSLDWE